MVNPILEWPFNEASGNVLDATGNGNGFTPSGNNGRTAAGGGYTFGGSVPNAKGFTQSASDTQSALTGAMTAFNTSARTVMFWGKIPGTDPSHVMEYNNSGAGTGVFTWLMLSGVFRFRAKDSSNNVYERNLISAPTVFHHYCATHDGTNLKVYVDGAQVGANVAMAVAVWSADSIKVLDTPGTAAVISHVRIFNAALTSGEITTWMNTPTPTATGATDLVAADMSVATSEDSTVLTQVHNLAVADATVASRNDSVSLASIIDLAINKMLVATRNDAPNLTQVHQIVVSDMFLNTSADLVNMSGLAGGPMSVSDLQAQKLPVLTGKTGSVQDLLFFYYGGLSGLAPVARFSISDHQKAYYAAQTGLPGSLRSISDLEKAFYDQLLVPSGSLSDREFVYWTGL